MLQFDSDDSRLVLNISGHTFTILANSDLAERVALLAGEAALRADAAHESGEYDIGGVCGFLCRIIDSLVGEGTVETIFGDDEPDVFDLCDIISYICDEFSAYRRRRLSRLAKDTDREVVK